MKTTRVSCETKFGLLVFLGHPILYGYLTSRLASLGGTSTGGSNSKEHLLNRYKGLYSYFLKQCSHSVNSVQVVYSKVLPPSLIVFFCFEFLFFRVQRNNALLHTYKIKSKQIGKTQTQTFSAAFRGMGPTSCLWSSVSQIFVKIVFLQLTLFPYLCIILQCNVSLDPVSIAFSLTMFHRTGHRFYIYEFSLRMFHRTGHQGGAAPPPYSQTQNYDPISKYQATHA